MQEQELQNIRYNAIMCVMNREELSQNQAARIVGGKMRLEHLGR